MNSQEFSQLPPQAQASIKSQMLINAMNGYGKKVVEVEVAGRKGKTTEAPFANLNHIRQVDNFVELEKGCELWMVGEKYPVRMCLNNQKIDTIHRFKRLIPTLVKSSHPLIAIIYFRLHWKNYLEFLWNGMRDVYYSDSKFYSQPIREIYRACNYLSFNSKMRDIVCAILEFDTSYRYRFQDIIVEFDKKRLVENPLLEIKRVVNILFEREVSDNNGMKKFKKALPFVFFYLKFNKKLLNSIALFILECDLSELKSSKEDLYWQDATNEASDYDYRGLDSVTRYNQYLKTKVA